MARETFKDIPGYEGLYQVSNLGNIKSYPRTTTKGGLLKPNTNSGYRKVTLSKNGKLNNIKISRVIALTFLGLDLNNRKLVVDHINRDILDDSLNNLRICTVSQNAMNKIKPTKGTSKYKGVRFCNWNKMNPWRAQIMLNGKSKYIGYFKHEKEAGKAYDKKAISLFGEFACLNFNY